MFENFYCNIQLLSEDAKMPIRANKGDAGLDVFTPIDFDIESYSDILIPLDIRVDFPKGYVMIVKEKSGIATKMKLHVGAAVIDQQYKGNCHCHLFNSSDKLVKFKKGQKVAQVLIVPIWDGQPTQVDEIFTKTSRGEKGFGSTGDR